MLAAIIFFASGFLGLFASIKRFCLADRPINPLTKICFFLQIALESDSSKVDIFNLSSSESHNSTSEELFSANLGLIPQ